MNHQTRVTQVSVRQTAGKPEQTARQLTQPVELPKREARWKICFLQADRLVRNFAVVGALLLTVLAVRSNPAPEAQSVFSALQDSVGMEWDESVGKLSFVNSLLPQALQEVWNPSASLAVYAPVKGETLHAWSQHEPYITILSRTDKIRAAADGEVMSIAHGMDEEKIIRVRHDDATEAVYGNLAQSYVEQGQRVYAGDVIAQLMDDQTLAFELRVDGRSVNPDGRLMPFDE